MKGRIGFTIAVLLLAILFGVMFAVSVAATDPAPATVVGTKGVVLRNTLPYIGDAVTRSEHTEFYAVADVFYTLVMSEANNITPYIEFSPDNLTWSRTSLTVVADDMPRYLMTRTALYSNYFRFGFDATGTTIRYTPTVKLVLKNLGDP